MAERMAPPVWAAVGATVALGVLGPGGYDFQFGQVVKHTATQIVVRDKRGKDRRFRMRGKEIEEIGSGGTWHSATTLFPKHDPAVAEAQASARAKAAARNVEDAMGKVKNALYGRKVTVAEFDEAAHQVAEAARQVGEVARQVDLLRAAAVDQETEPDPIARGRGVPPSNVGVLRRDGRPGFHGNNLVDIPCRYDESAPMESWDGIDGPVMMCLNHGFPAAGEAYDDAATVARCAWWKGAK